MQWVPSPLPYVPSFEPLCRAVGGDQGAVVTTCISTYSVRACGRIWWSAVSHWDGMLSDGMTGKD